MDSDSHRRAGLHNMAAEIRDFIETRLSRRKATVLQSFEVKGRGYSPLVRAEGRTVENLSLKMWETELTSKKTRKKT